MEDLPGLRRKVEVGGVGGEGRGRGRRRRRSREEGRREVWKVYLI